MRLPRSYLYVPGNAADKLAKATRWGADALIVDLEDAVPAAEKETATESVLRWMGASAELDGCQVWVRINDGTLRGSDVADFAGIPALTGLVLSKVRDGDEVDEVAAQLEGLGDRDTLLMPILETASAILDARSIAGRRRVHQLQVGEVDLSADAGITPGADGAELAWARGMVVLASAACGIHPPVGPVSRHTRDEQALAESTRAVRRQGFFGRACIHPAQIPVVHMVFTPSAEELAEAREVLEAFARATASGAGVLLDDAGRLVDKAVVRGARITVAAAADTHPAEG